MINVTPHITLVPEVLKMFYHASIVLEVSILASDQVVAQGYAMER